ncbi:MAG: hypothetical protein QOI52_1710, partial [Chloroflexota bacterium]|nr:hypothetical protein [Chloroflexota bacterium]
MIATLAATLSSPSVQPAFAHALLGLSVAALAGAGLRAASPLAAAGLTRALVAATLASAAAVAEALALGLFALGGSTLALSAAALLTWAAARALLPEPRLRISVELVAWWRGLGALQKAGLGALLGAGAAWTAWQLRYPALGFDTVVYHLPEIVLWIQHGTPGSIETLIPDQPVGNYPLTAEVTLAWAMGIARSFVPLTLLPWAWLVLIAGAGWAGLRALAVGPPERGLAIAALCTSPWLLAWQSNGTITDPAALAWLVTCAALCALSRAHAPLLAPALLAGALSIGSKTTTLPWVLLVLAIAFWPARARLRSLARPLALALAASLAVGGVWYLRDLVTHGSPFWPIVAAPWGDPIPKSIAIVDTSFLDRLGPTIDRIGQDYLDRFGGGIVLLAGGMLAVAAAGFRDRRVRWASLFVALGFLLWARAPVTGVPAETRLDGVIFSTTRYLLPVLAGAAVALALAASGRGAGALLARVVLAAVVVVNLVQTFDLGFPLAPSAVTPLVGAAAGALVALALGVAAGAHLHPRRLRLAPSLRPAAGALVAAAVACLLAIPAAGYLAHHGETNPIFTAAV